MLKNNKLFGQALRNIPFARSFAFAFAMLVSVSLMAQNTITGTVSDASTSDGIGGVTIVVKGTQMGAFSNPDGSYSVSAADDATLVFTYLGYATQEVAVAGQSTINVALAPEGITTDEVVISALGIKKEKKKLAYAVSELDGADVSLGSEPNMVNNLSGKVAGVQVQKNAGGPGASTSVTIRGNSSLGGNNQPLYIVDGIPIDNSNIGPAGRWGGIDYGDGIGDLNPDDIATMSVLKGPSAAALYGSRAANGVIIISTKKGGTQDGLGIEYVTSLTFENPLVLPDFQNEYGHGTGGAVPGTVEGLQGLGVGGALGISWGDKMNGQSALSWDGTTKAYSAQEDNLRDFYDTGLTWTNTVALTGGDDDSHFRVSLHNIRNQGILPTSTYDRYAVNLRGGANLTDKLSADVKLNYIHNDAYNRPWLSDAMENVANGLLHMPRNVDINDLANYKSEEGTLFDGNADDYAAGVGIMRHYTRDAFRMNPYWGINENINEDKKDRMLSMASLNYQIAEGISFMVRSGLDLSLSDRMVRRALNTRYNPRGNFNVDQYVVRENNNDVLFIADRELSESFRATLTAGANWRRSKTTQVGATGNSFLIPGFYSLSNTADQQPRNNIFIKEVWSAYGQLSTEFKGFFFVDASLRTDKSSSLTKADGSGENQYFYPAVSASLLLTDAFGIESDVLDYAKVRGSWARVGNDANPYVNSTSYNLRGINHLGRPMGVVGNVGGQDEIQNPLPLLDLKPEQTESIELGAELSFLKRRVNLDVAWYQANTTDQILATTISSTSGYPSAVINAGEMENSGIEILLSGKPVKTADLTWEIAFNFAQNNNEVVSLIDGVDQLTLGTDRGISVQARPGQAFGVLIGKGYARDANGNKIFDADGLAVVDNDLDELGNAIPDWIGGVRNTVTYKGISLSALIDIRQGGSLYSVTNRNAHANGNHVNTLEGREAFYNGTGGYVGQGVNEAGEVNTVAVDPEVYWGHIYNNEIVEDFVYDASFIKLRQLAIGYDLPASMIANTPFKGVSVSLVGRNLAFLKNNVPGIDPESSFTSGASGLGLESGALPSTRSLGFNVGVKF